MKIKFLGAAGTVTGSSYLLTSNTGEQILIDLGMFQGSYQIEALNYAPFEADCKSLIGVLLTHAHLDHCGRLPILEKNGYQGKIYMTAPTADLTELSLLDSAKIGAEDHPDKILYTKTDVYDLIKRFETVNYNQQFNIGSFEITFRDAGHIIGSATIEIVSNGQKIVFSGDLGNSPEDLAQPTKLIDSASVVVMESTYGDKAHPEGLASDAILNEIKAVEANGGALLIPAFSLERTQELLHIISHLKLKGLVKSETPIYLDSPMAEKATVIYEKYRSFMNDEIKSDFAKSDPFNFPGLKVIEKRVDSVNIRETPGTKVIISGSGMMNGGRIVSHAKALLSDPTTRLLIVGYQAEDTLGREIQLGRKAVIIENERVEVNANISETQVMSSHADQPRLMSWLAHIQGTKKIFVSHGEDRQRSILSELIKTQLKITDISLPTQNQEFEF